jgi:hypothetical protein
MHRKCIFEYDEKSWQGKSANGGDAEQPALYTYTIHAPYVVAPNLKDVLLRTINYGDL